MDIILNILQIYIASMIVSFALPKAKPFDRSNVLNHITMFWFSTKRNAQLKALTEEKSGFILFLKASYMPHTIKNLHKDEFWWIKTDMWERLIK